MSKPHPELTTKAAAKARRKRRNEKRLKHWAGERHNVDLKRHSLMQQAMRSISNFFPKQEVEIVWVHVSKRPGDAKGVTYRNPTKKLKRAAAKAAKAAKKKRWTTR